MHEQRLQVSKLLSVQTSVFTWAVCDRTRGNGFKPTESRFRQDIRKIFLAVRVVRHWSRLPTAKCMDKNRKFPPSLHIQHSTAFRHKNLTSSLMCSTCSSRKSFLSVSDLFFFNSDWPIRAANSKSRSFCEALRIES